MTLHRIKHKMGANPKADIWCHFGSATIRVPPEGRLVFIRFSFEFERRTERPEFPVLRHTKTGSLA